MKKKLTNRERIEKEEARLRGEMVDGWGAFQNIKKEGRMTNDEKERAQAIVDKEWTNYKELEVKKEAHKESKLKPMSEEEAVLVIQANTKILKEGKGEQLKNICQYDKGHAKWCGRHKAYVHFKTFVKGDPRIINDRKNFSFRTGEDTPYVVRGFDIAVLEMREGEIRYVVVPPELAFGEKSIPGHDRNDGSFDQAIPRYSTMEFEIELVDYHLLTPMWR